MKKILQRLRFFISVVTVNTIKQIPCYIKKGDIIIAILYLLSLILLSIFIFDKGSGKAQVEIQTTNDTYIYQLSKNIDLQFNGPLGTTLVQIQDEKVSVLDSPGPLKICIKSSPIQKNGEWLACLPNHIFIRIVKEKSNPSPVDVDAIVF